MRLLAPALLLLVGCPRPPPAIVVELDIAAEKVPCVGESARMCLLVSEDGGPLEAFYDDIDGYTHIWGVATTLRVDRQEIEEPPADGSSVSWTRLATTASTARQAGDSFTLTFDPAQGSFFDVEAGTTDATLVDGTELLCQEAAVCTALAAADEGEATFEVDFLYGEPLDGPIGVSGVE